MDRRPQLQQLLETLISEQPEDKLRVYFQPPPNVQMEYPCIVYSNDAEDSQFAGNKPYRRTKRWLVTYIDWKAVSEVPELIAALPLCTFSRSFAADNLNHTAYTLYF